MTAIIDVVTTRSDVEFDWTLIVRGQLVLLGICDFNVVLIYFVMKTLCYM